MAIATFSHVIFFFCAFFSAITTAAAIDIAAILAPFSDLSDFRSFMINTTIAGELTNRSSITILALSNTVVRSSDLPHCPQTAAADVLRNQVLLQYISQEDLLQIPPTGRLLTTLFQATGRAKTNVSSIIVTRDSSKGSTFIRSYSLHSGPTAAILSPVVYAIPCQVIVFNVTSLILPCQDDIMASESLRFPSVNVTEALINGHKFKIVASMLTGSGVEQEFEADEGGAGITVFAPTDSAFDGAAGIQSLPADKKAQVMRYHVLHSYYTLGSLESIVNPVQPTLATESNGAASYTLNISRVNGSVALYTGIMQATVTETVFDQNPVSIFGISSVLLPSEIFGKNHVAPIRQPVGGATAGSRFSSPPDGNDYYPSMSPPQYGHVVYSPPSRLSSPPELRDIASTANIVVFSSSIATSCIWFHFFMW